MSRRRVTSAVAAAALALPAALLAGCTSAADEPGGERQTLTVLAAASLTESFDALAKRFEAEHPGVHVAASYDSSATIATQVVAGAPADVVATADTRTMGVMRDGKALAGPPVVFTHNRLALVVPPDNPAGVDRLADLQRADYVTCVKSAPCGDLASQLLDRSGIGNPPRSYEVDVKAVLTKVELGEADAGFVYVSDVVAAGRSVREVPLPPGTSAATEYPIAVTAEAEHPDLARAWVDLVRSRAGQQVLSRSGFASHVGALPSS